jgi:2-oxoglutarate ferredoxin oxidoreductase subunit alpha
VGVLAELLSIELEALREALNFHFKGKEKPVALNYGVIENAAKWAAENLTKSDPYRVERMDGTKGFIMVDGNTAGALGAIWGGFQFASWYPITPASSLAEKLGDYASELRQDPEKPEEKNYAIIQAEDELAAIGMAVGAGWAGLRAMTSTSGPGISLMTEFAGLAYYSEVPVVIWDVQRVGPSTGMPTRTAQGDVTQVYFLGHGDTQSLILFPSSGNECFEFGWKAFDISERFQTPVFVLSDLDLGMNQWMTQPFEYPDQEMDRGKVLWEEGMDNWSHDKPWGRYLDVDKDGIPYRTVPGNRNPRSAYFARGTGHDDNAKYTERPDDWEKNMERLARKFANAREALPAPVMTGSGKEKIGILAYGSTEPAILEAMDRLAADGIQTDYLRLRALPISKAVREFIDAHEMTYVVEMNRDGQVHQILKIEIAHLSDKMDSVVKHDGLPLTARVVHEAILEKVGK